MESRNTVFLSGAAGCAPVCFSSGEKGAVFTLLVMRESGVFDKLPVRLAENAAQGVKAGDRLSVAGKILAGSGGGGTHGLPLCVAAGEISVFREYDNRAFLSGFLCKKPLYRRTPMGREVCELTLAVKEGGKSFVPCIVWGEEAREAARMKPGEGLSIEGRLQSRDYRKKTEGGFVISTAFEVSVSRFFLRETVGIGKNLL